MSVLTQGSQVFMLDPENSTIVEIESVTSFVPGGAPAGQIDDTNLKDTIKRYKRGLRDPGQATLGVNADPTEPSHVRLYELSQSDLDMNARFFVGWSDGTGDPTYDSATSSVTLPTTRTWFDFEGYVADFPLDFSTDTIVTSEVSIQRSGKGTWTQKGVA